MKKIFILGILLSNTVFGQVVFKQSRVILDESQGRSQSITIANNHNNIPYLAQSWIEDAQGVKITAPLVAVPMLQRLNPNQEKQVKISLSDDMALLPTDRESVYYFNVLGVPPKDGPQNKVGLVFQSKAKIFYRPKGLPAYKSSGWIQEMELQKSGNSLTLNNPTAYHVNIYGFGAHPNGKIVEKEVLLKPFSTETVNVSLTGNTPLVYIVNDYGVSVSIQYDCNSGRNCQKKP